MQWDTRQPLKRMMILFIYCLVTTSELYFKVKKKYWGFPGGAVVESLPANAGDTGSSPGLGGSRMPRSN